MNEACQALRSVFAEEIEFLRQIRDFLHLLPQLLAERRVRELAFFNFMDVNEVRGRDLLRRKQRALAAVAAQLGVPPDRVTFHRLADMGYGEFAGLGRELSQSANELSYALLRAAVHLRSFARLNHSTQRLLDFFQPQAYSRGGHRPPTAGPARVMQEG